MGLKQSDYFRVNKSFLLDEDFQSIQEEVKAGYIRKSAYPDYPELNIYNYTDKCTFDEHWNKWTKMCRGLVVNDNTQEVIIWCIPKFFNQGEPYAAKVDFMNSDITLKEDGYMIQFTYHEDYGLVVTSRGSFDSKYSQFVYNFLKDKITTTSQSGVRYSYMLELCKDFPGDESIIVTKHPKDRLICWAVTDLVGAEVNLYSIGDNWLPKEIEIVRSFTPEEAKKYLKGEVEGVVLRNREYPNERVKVKTDWFLKMHRLISNCTKKRVWELLSEGKRVESLEGIPNEFVDMMKEWEDDFLYNYSLIITVVENELNKRKEFTDKEIALDETLSKEMKAYIFALRKKGIKQLSSILWKKLKPKGEDSNEN